jgi:hypothetical protein
LTKADIVFSNVTNLTAGVSFVCGGSAVDSYQCPTNPPYSDWQAGAFTPAANYKMTNAQVVVSGADSSDPTFNVFLYRSSAQYPQGPGSMIEQIGFALTASGDYPGTIVTANSIRSPITLVSGISYWLVLAPADPTSFLAWQLSEGGNHEIFTGAVSNYSGSNWSVIDPHGNFITAGQFVINGVPQTATPEPSSALLMAAAVIVLFSIRYRAPRRC